MTLKLYIHPADFYSEEMEAPGVWELDPNMFWLKLGQIMRLFKSKLLTLLWDCLNIFLKKVFFLKIHDFDKNSWIFGLFRCCDNPESMWVSIGT